MSDLEKISGVVEQLRFTTHISGSENSTNTSHIAIFNIGNQPVSVSLSSVPILSDGDDVDVVGYISRGVFHARAYYNHSQEVWDSSATTLNYLLGFALLPLFGLGILFLRQGYINKQAERILLDFEWGEDENVEIEPQSARDTEIQDPPLTRNIT